MKPFPELSRNFIFRPLLLIAVLGSIVLGIRYLREPAGVESAPVVRIEREVMGTLWAIQVVAESQQERVLAGKAIEAAFGELVRIDALMSDWKEESPLSSVNFGAGRGATEVPEELAAIIARGIRFGELTEGAFDITWKGMEKLWHFNDAFEPPTQAIVDKALQSVDYRKILIQGPRVSIPEGFAIGLGGIAKGYAIDRAGAILEESGFHDFLVNGGGDILAGGTRGPRPWSVGIRDPRGGPNELLAKVRLSDGAVVTSGDYERYRIVNSVRYHHIIDPRTGYPADKCRSVTIISETAEQADVLATAVFVLGPEKGFPLVTDFAGTEAFVVDASGRFWMTDGFREVAEIYAAASQ